MIHADNTETGFKAVIFDLDGTLLDTLADLAASMNRVLDSRGMPVHPLKAYRKFVGDGAAMLVRRTLPPEHVSDRMVSECLEAFLN
ncbi:MAG TPA: HAD family hydrolase, partial [Thermodesulfobacteriaceae bacterium]|nr:HAD family hydrolase [Thermodesulfobacteriaceae bacterium]